MANGERNFLLFSPFSYSVNYRRIYIMHLKESRFVENQNEIKLAMFKLH